MRHSPEVQAADLARAVSGLPEFSSTSLATGMGAITREVMKRGAAVITKHDAPVMVLVSIERYAELERASAPDLDALTARFDGMYARMQAPDAAERTIAALDLGAQTTPRQLVEFTGASARAAGTRATTAKSRKLPVRRRA